MQNPTETHLTTLKRLPRYLKGIIFHDLLLNKNPTSRSQLFQTLIGQKIQMIERQPLHILFILAVHLYPRA